MNIIEVFVRILLACVVIFFSVIVWALIPYLQNAEIDTSIMSIFFGNNKAVLWTRDLLLLSRAVMGLSLALYILMPVSTFFADVNVSNIRRDICLLLVGISICAWISALVYHFMFVI